MENGRLCVAVRSEVSKDNFRSVKEFREEMRLDGVVLEKLEAFVDRDNCALRIEAPLAAVEGAAQEGGRVRLQVENKDTATPAAGEPSDPKQA